MKMKEALFRAIVDIMYSIHSNDSIIWKAVIEIGKHRKPHLLALFDEHWIRVAHFMRFEQGWMFE